jgi:hypothetical protein
MKKVANLSLNDQIHVLKKDFVNENISERVWYETVELKVKRLEYDEATNDIIVNKGMEDTQSLPMLEEVHTNGTDARTLVDHLNDRELKAEQKIHEELQKKLANSKKVMDFFTVELKKVGL